VEICLIIYQKHHRNRCHPQYQWTWLKELLFLLKRHHIYLNYIDPLLISLIKH